MKYNTERPPPLSKSVMRPAVVYMKKAVNEKFKKDTPVEVTSVVEVDRVTTPELEDNTKSVVLDVEEPDYSNSDVFDVEDNEYDFLV